MTAPLFPNNLLRRGMAYAQSDIYYDGNLQELYNECGFVCVQTRDHKIFANSYLKRSKKEDKVIKLIQSGSVFWLNEPSEFAKKVENKHVAAAGFNKIIIGGNAQ